MILLLAAIVPCLPMASVGFDTLTLQAVTFSVVGIVRGKIHYVTRSMLSRSDLAVLRDAPGGQWVVVAEAPMPKVLEDEHVLTVALQHPSGRWVVRSIRMRTYFAAIKVEHADGLKHGSRQGAAFDAQQFAVRPLGRRTKPRVDKASQVVRDYAVEKEQEFMASGELWARRADGMPGWGLPQQYFIAGGEFVSAPSRPQAEELARVQQQLVSARAELVSLSPRSAARNNNIPLSALVRSDQCKRDKGLCQWCRCTAGASTGLARPVGRR